MSVDTPAITAPDSGNVTGALPTPSLRKNFTWTFFGNVIYSACQWGILVVLAKLGNPETVGKYALGLAVTAPVMMFSQLQLRGVQATDAKREYAFGDYLALRLLTTALALAAVVGIAAFAGYGRETTLVILVVGGMKAIDSLSDVYFGLWQQNERMEGIAKVMAVNGIVSVVALGVAMWYTHSVVWAALASAAGSAVALAFALWRNRPMAAMAGETAHPRWHTLTLWRLARLAMPLGIVMMLISLNANIPRYFIQQYLGERELGIFAAAAYLVISGTIVIGAVGQACLPRLARYFALGDDTRFRRLVLQLLLVGGAVGLTGLLVSLICGRWILATLYTPEYSVAWGVWNWMMGAAAIAYLASFLGYAMTAARVFAPQTPLFVVVVAVTVMACVVFVPGHRLYGAAWGSALGFLAQLVGSIVVFRKRRLLEGGRWIAASQLAELKQSPR